MTKKRQRQRREQIVKASQKGEAMMSAGKTESEVFQALAISAATWERRKKHNGGMKSDETKRLRELEIENQRLKEPLAEAELDKKILEMAAGGNF